MATSVGECVYCGVNHIQTAYLSEFDRTRHWSKNNLFDYGTNFNNPESQLKINSGGYENRKVVLIK